MAKSEAGRNSGRNSLPLNNMCWTVAESAHQHARFNCFLTSFSRLLCTRILQNNLLDLYLVEIRRYKLSFFAKKPQKHTTENGHFTTIGKNRCVKLKTDRGLELGPNLAKSINFLWAKFGGNRK